MREGGIGSRRDTLRKRKEPEIASRQKFPSGNSPPFSTVATTTRSSEGGRPRERKKRQVKQGERV